MSSVDGHVVDAASHDPIAGATVRIGAILVGTTDDGGRFTLNGLCPGRFELVIERDDYMVGERVVALDDHVAVEIELHSNEVIEIEDKAPPPTDMRSATTVSGAALERNRGKSFTAAIAEVPGVTELRSATGVAKPIIRGQFGRRLVMLVDGVRHRSQEWGLEHAPEVDPFVAEAIRVVRGAGGVRYGSDAIGGAVLVDPPALRRTPGMNGEAHAIGAWNGLGGTLAGRLQAVAESLPGLSIQIEGSGKRLAAARTPDYALANTGVAEWNAGLTVGYRTRRGGRYTLSYRHHDAELGVCACLRIDSIDDFLAQAENGRPIGADAYDATFAIARAKQRVQHDVAIARAQWGRLVATYAFQHDYRREYDVVRNAATAGAQFNFRLITNELDVQLDHDPVHLSEHWHLRGAVGLSGLVQLHQYAGLPLIPDYTAFGGGVFATERLVGHDTEIELGARYDVLARRAAIERNDFLRLVRSDQIASDACGEDLDPAQCRSRFHTFVGSAGALQRFGGFALKGELSVASRAPNPDEQYLNGAAPSFPVLGLGKPDLRPETTYSSSVTASYEDDHLKAEASVFANFIDDYIYFGPAVDAEGMPIYDVTIRGTFPRFATRPVDAVFYGVDGGVTYAPIAQLEVGAQASLVRAKNVDDDSYLVFVPADHYRGTATYRPWPGTFATLMGTFVARQSRYDATADFVAPPPAYFLLGAEVGTETTIADRTIRFALQGSNLTNTRYRDYTSLMRYFADEPGVQVWLRASVTFDSENHK